jgi:hypothetical protein
MNAKAGYSQVAVGPLEADTPASFNSTASDLEGNRCWMPVKVGRLSVKNVFLAASAFFLASLSIRTDSSTVSGLPATNVKKTKANQRL